MNAIERLLNLIAADQDTPETYEAAAAVDALYQAADDVVRQVWERRDKEEHPALGRLAAAVRRVEGDPVDDAAIEQQVRYRDAWDTGERITIEELERRVEGE